MSATARSDAEIAAAAAAAPTPTLEVEDVRRSFGDREILRGVDLVLEPGARAFLGGHNGAGKTTLLRIIAGVLAPHVGRVRLGGLDPINDRGAYQRRLGYLPAGNGGLYARLTVRQNLEFWAALGLLTAAARKEAIDRTIAGFGLTELAARRCDRISMGQRQRVRLATTFIHEPTLILLDEPHTSLDDPALELLRQALEAHHDRGGTSLWCAPASSQAAIESDASWIIDAGLARRA
jgi:heme ABC exporter ATP-binding subunit CcmA